MSLKSSDYKNNPLWDEKRRQVIARSGGVCEECHARTGDHVHHLRYSPDGIGHEPIEWLLHLCTQCHQAKHPNRRFLTTAQRKHRAMKRRAKGRMACKHCGGTYSKKKHRTICLRFGLSGKSVSPRELERRERESQAAPFGRKNRQRTA